MAEIIRGSGVRKVRSAIVPIQRNGAKPPLFCIGPVGGEVIVFRRLADELGEDQPLFGLQPFGLGDSSKTLLTVEDIAAHYVEQIKAVHQNPRHCIMGYCFGGLVAIEMARQLSKNGEDVAAVVLIDTNNLAASKAQEQFRDRIRRYRYHLRETFFGPGGLNHLRDRLRDNYLRVLEATAARIGLPTSTLASSLPERQSLASEKYRAGHYAGRVYLFKAESRPEFFDDSPTLGWDGILSDLVLREVPGDHNTINTGSNIKILAQELARCLRALQ